MLHQLQALPPKQLKKRWKIPRYLPAGHHQPPKKVRKMEGRGVFLLAALHYLDIAKKNPSLDYRCERGFRSFF